MTTPDLHYRRAALHSMHNKKDVLGSQVVGCYHCQRVYKPDEIKEWVDPEQDTAVCPHCSVDAVLPGAVAPMTAEFLAKANAYWFSPSRTPGLRS